MQEIWVPSLVWEDALLEEKATHSSISQYSCLGNPMDRVTWEVTLPGVTKSLTWLSDWTTTIIYLHPSLFSYRASITSNHKISWPIYSSDGKESACNAGDLGSILGSERYPGEGTGNPLQYSCLQNSMARGAWWAIVRGVAKSWHD